MEWITSSKLFKSSKYKDKILAAINDPINKPLVQQLTSYVDSDYVEDDIPESVPETEEVESPKSSKQSSGKHSGGGSSHSMSMPSGANGHFDMPEDVDFEDGEELDSGDLDISDEESEPSSDQESDESLEESTKLNKSSINSSTYVTVETVSQAVQEIPGTLNLREDTAGVNYTALKGGSTNELWIYYDSGVDISKVLDKVNSALINSGYYFLEFNRVSRDDNAIVFTINWISNYFKPISIEDETNE